MANRKSLNRRQFMKRTAGVAIGGFAFPYIIPSSVLGKSQGVAPSNKIAVGCVGVGNQGRDDMRSFLEQSDAHVVAVCDVDANHLQKAKRDVDRKYGNKDCAAYRNFRDLIARNDIDVVQITTPDHWHVPVAIAAAKAGKDMYGEKPFAQVTQSRKTTALKSGNISSIWPEIFVVNSTENHCGFFNNAIYYVFLHSSSVMD